MRRNKWRVTLAGALLLCTLAFTTFSSPRAMASTQNMICPPIVGPGGITVVAGQTVPPGTVESYGPDIKKLQSELKISADGQFGQVTYDTLKAYQLANGLTPDGYAGPKTWGKLGQCWPDLDLPTSA